MAGRATKALLAINALFLAALLLRSLTGLIPAHAASAGTSAPSLESPILLSQSNLSTGDVWVRRGNRIYHYQQGQVSDDVFGLRLDASYDLGKVGEAGTPLETGAIAAR